MASSGGSTYFHFTDPKRRTSNVDDVQRGIQIGQEIGKLIGGVAGAVKSSQADAAANKLMNTENAPRAALVDPGSSPAPGGPQPASGDGTIDPNADLSTDLPENVSPTQSVQVPPQTFTNPATGNVQPVSGTGGTYSGTGTDPTLAANAGAANAAAALQKNVIPAGVSTAGTQPYTGGVAGMKMQQELQKSQLAQQAAQAKAADAAQKAAGTGPYAVEAALKQVQLQQARQNLQKSQTPKPAAPVKNPPAVNIGSEPVVDQNQLNNHIDSIYGKGAANSMASAINEPAQIPDPANPGQMIANPNAPQVGTDSITVPTGPKKSVTIPLAEAQTYTKQYNALRLKQGLPAYRVPGEDQTVGATADNPYIAKNNLDVYSRAPGTWIRLPNGKIAQVPQR